MKYIDTALDRLNHFQQKHTAIGFLYAVVKKYGDNMGGYHAALLTYYGFLSLFPLLLVLLTVLRLWFHNNPALRDAVSNNISHYFPLLGSQLQSNITSLRGAGIGVAIGILLAIYGTRGGADALRFALDASWYIPKSKRAGFPKNILKSLAIISVSALGFLATVATSIAAAAVGQGMWVNILVHLCGATILSLSLAGVFMLGLSRPVPLRKVLYGAVIAGIIIQLLTTFGGLLIARQLHNLDTLYGTFAVVLGLLFWIYLLAQVLLYAMEIDTVRTLRLWPRSMNGNQPTAADQHAYRLQAKAEQFIPAQQVRVGYIRPKQ